jgi:uracil-DNA glycosylase
MTRSGPLARIDQTELPPAALAKARSGRADLGSTAVAARRCQACPLFERATQTVFGEGPVNARLFLVGEQPGDQEDRAGSPFVGPAGRVLDRALVAAGIEREAVFLTNVVKHFKWRPAASGKRRLHERPTRAEVGACLPWVEAELALVRPTAVVVLGATAAQALLGPGVRVTRDHGRSLPSAIAPVVVATIHPSAVLRAEDKDARESAFAGLVDDLIVAKRLAGTGTRRRARAHVA